MGGFIDQRHYRFKQFKPPPSGGFRIWAGWVQPRPNSLDGGSRSGGLADHFCTAYFASSRRRPYLPFMPSRLRAIRNVRYRVPANWRCRPAADARVAPNTSQERLGSVRRSVKWWCCLLVTTMSTTEKFPKSMAEKFSAITAHTDAFCEKHLHDEYRVVIHRVIGTLARKRPSPLLRGEENVWAAAAVHAVGRVNFLDDPSQTPHCKPKVIYEFFGVAESTGQRKSKEIRD
jgi:hypothetical protein